MWRLFYTYKSSTRKPMTVLSVLLTKTWTSSSDDNWWWKCNQISARRVWAKCMCLVQSVEECIESDKNRGGHLWNNTKCTRPIKYASSFKYPGVACAFSWSQHADSYLQQSPTTNKSSFQARTKWVARTQEHHWLLMPALIWGGKKGITCPHAYGPNQWRVFFVLNIN